MQKLAQIYMHSWRQRCKIDNFVFDISIHPNMRMLEKGKIFGGFLPLKSFNTLLAPIIVMKNPTKTIATTST